MDRHLAGEAVTARFLGFAAQRRGIAEVDRDGVDGLHPRRRGARRPRRGRASGAARGAGKGPRTRPSRPGSPPAPSAAEGSPAPRASPPSGAPAPPYVPARNNAVAVSVAIATILIEPSGRP